MVNNVYLFFVSFSCPLLIVSLWTNSNVPKLNVYLSDVCSFLFNEVPKVVLILRTGFFLFPATVVVNNSVWNRKKSFGRWTLLSHEPYILILSSSEPSLVELAKKYFKNNNSLNREYITSRYTYFNVFPKFICELNVFRENEIEQ